MNEPPAARDSGEELPPLSLDEAARILERLEPALTERRIVLIGGQAVALWSAQLVDYLTGKAVFFDSDGYKRTLDFLAQPYGLNADDVDETAIEIEVPSGDHKIPLWVMHPERCLRSRVANSALPNKQTDLAWRQLERAIECVRAFSLLLLDMGVSTSCKPLWTTAGYLNPT